MEKSIVIAIDGPAGSGKSTLAKSVAKELGFIYLDTGAMYRAVTFAAIKNKIEDNSEEIIKLTKEIDLELKFEVGINKIFIDNTDVTNEIRTLSVSSKVSEISKIKEVREELVCLQRKIGSKINIVVEGRDTTTIVFPEAALKIFLVASIEERAKRRFDELKENNFTGSYEEVYKNLSERDKLDSGREISPLVKADDAVELDTTSLSVEEEVKFIIDKAKEKQLI
ncbi:MAG: (d)CMP kinase [Rhodothermaceae bacterium]